MHLSRECQERRMTACSRRGVGYGPMLDVLELQPRTLA